jgi:predicted nucleic acid-binding Zn ribbon protein
VSPRSRPHALRHSVRAIRARAEPKTLLAATQSAWRPAVGERIAREARPLRERDGVITVSCAAATWAQELDLLQDELLGRLNEAVAPRRISALRFIVGDESAGGPL